MRAILLLVLVLLGAGLTTAVEPGGLTFGAADRLPDSANVGEPMLVTDGAGRLAIAAPGQGVTNVWHAGPEGAWARGPSVPGRGDSDVAFDAAGRLYATGITVGGPVSMSEDGGASWRYTTMSAREGPGDRIWIAAEGDGHVLVEYRKVGGRAVVSRNAGLTWSAPVDVFPTGGKASKPVLRGESAWVADVDAQSILVAISHDGGTKWTLHTVAPAPDQYTFFPSLAVGDDGALYLALAEAQWPGGTSMNVVFGAPVVTSTSVVLYASHDGGTTWTRSVVAPPGPAHVMASVVAGAEGKVAVAWYRSDDAPFIDPDFADTASWHVHVAVSQDAGMTWEDAPATGVIHQGSLCWYGSSCFNEANIMDRALLDFLGPTVLPDGRLAIAYIHGDRGAPSESAIEVVTQTGGPRLR